MLKLKIDDAFSLRPEDRVAFWDLERTVRMDKDYAIMVLDVPALPEPSHEVCRPVTVLCAQILSGTWRWVPLAPSTKDALLLIADAANLARGKWHGMEIGVNELQVAAEQAKGAS